MGLEDQPEGGWEIRTGAAQKGLCLHRLIYHIFQKNQLFSKKISEISQISTQLPVPANQDTNKAAAGTANIPLPKDRVSSPV